jgi:hypothetical protein
MGGAPDPQKIVALVYFCLEFSCMGNTSLKIGLKTPANQPDTLQKIEFLSGERR